MVLGVVDALECVFCHSFDLGKARIPRTAEFSCDGLLLVGCCSLLGASKAFEEISSLCRWSINEKCFRYRLERASKDRTETTEGGILLSFIPEAFFFIFPVDLANHKSIDSTAQAESVIFPRP